MDKNDLMKNLGITAAQADELLAADKKIDKMNRASEINSDLSEAQIKLAKKARSAERKRTTYKFNSNREKKINQEKKDIIIDIISSLGDVESLNVINDEREIEFVKNSVKYKILLSCPRNSWQNKNFMI